MCSFAETVFKTNATTSSTKKSEVQRVEIHCKQKEGRGERGRELSPSLLLLLLLSLLFLLLRLIFIIALIFLLIATTHSHAPMFFTIILIVTRQVVPVTTPHSPSFFFGKVPPGTMVYENSTGLLLEELKFDGQKFIVAKGGAGGKGNAAAKVARGQQQKVSRHVCVYGWKDGWVGGWMDGCCACL